MRSKLTYLSSLVLILLPLATFTHAQAENRTLVVNGQSGQATVVQANGRSYVDLETLARIGNGSVSFRAGQIVLTLPGSGASAANTTAPASNPPPDPGFSQAFMRAGIEELAVIREWRSSLAYIIQNGYPLSAESASTYRDQAAENSRLASAAASTNSDRNALPLLTSEFQNMQRWNTKLVDASKDMELARYSMGHSALENDSLYQKILTCAHFLAPMLTSGTFADDVSCH